MGSRIKLLNINFVRVEKAIEQAYKTIVGFFTDNAPTLITGALAVVSLDNLRLRFCRKTDQKHFEESTVKQQAVLRKHEAEINVLKSEAERVQEAKQMLELLKHIANNNTEEVLRSE